MRARSRVDIARRALRSRANSLLRRNISSAALLAARLITTGRVYDCITIPTLSLAAAGLLRAATVYFRLWTDNDGPTRRSITAVMFSRIARSPFGFPLSFYPTRAMTNLRTSSGRGCKKGGCAVLSLSFSLSVADTCAKCIRPVGDVLFNGCLFSSDEKVMPIVKLTDWETRRAKRVPRIRR